LAAGSESAVGVDGEDGVEVEEVEMGAWGVQAEHE
jgi:hypothetical protein